MKNQYIIQDASGINLVSSVDAYNFENTDSLYEFLACYGLISEYEDTEAIEKYQKDLEEYDEAWSNYNNAMEQYNSDYAQYLIDHENWENNQEDIYSIFSNAVGTSDIMSADFSSLPDSAKCYYNALHGDYGCYQHILQRMIDYDGTSNTYGNAYVDYTTSAGDTFNIYGTASGYMTAASNDEMQQISDAINATDSNGEYIRYCDGTDDLLNSTGVTNMLIQAKADYEAGLIDATDYKLYTLLSDFIDNGDGTYSIKSLKQKAIDMMYVLQNRNTEFSGSAVLTSDLMVEMLINFTDGDMKNLTIEPEEPTQPIKPEMAEPVKPSLIVVINDKEKGQWYTNLWYLMNGSETANLVKDDSDDTTNGRFVVSTVEKSATGQHNYKVLDDNLLNSSSWLQYALENGVITLLQTQYTNPGTDSGKAAELDSAAITWEAISYLSAVEISSTEDSLAKALAEAKYEKTTQEIQAEDNKYDIDLKRLDTEHTALETEYDSLKSVLDKNVERSFKAFS